MDVLGSELKQAWASITYLSLALIVSAWTVGVFGLSIILDSDEPEIESFRKKAGRREFLKTHVV